jgi:hypothetical protein
VLKSYTTDLPSVDCLVSQDNKTWIYSNASDVVKQVIIIFLQLFSVSLNVHSSTTPSIMSLLFVTWIPVVISGDTERNGLI